MSREYEAVYDLWSCWRSEASPPFQADLCGEQTGHKVRGRFMGVFMTETRYKGVEALDP